MAKDAAERIEDADLGEARETFFGSLARSAASAAVSVTVTFAVGWLLRKLADQAERPVSPPPPRR